MKSQDLKKLNPLNKKGADLAARAAEAEKQAETARNIARLAKARYKDARKNFKKAKKIAKQARKLAKAAAKALKAKAKGPAKKATTKTVTRPRTASRNGPVAPATSRPALKLPVPQISPSEPPAEQKKAQP